MVTGADSSHEKSLVQLLRSVEKHEPDLTVIVYDLGLTRNLKDQLIRDFKRVQLRTFKFDRYPTYFDIKINAGEYAWKPVIVHEVLNEFKCSVCWMDAGNLITGPLFYIKRIVIPILNNLGV